ncbi:hypothetical protein Cni_G29132 [Canna indica]|uniref:Transcription factor GAMYB n=1 Tax=Canna indica TaxID=4628 RepID=A0AAQ3LB20_9LILI|nr:hypothetical protein Cni_G29132 [Canna indica]
MPNIRLGTPNWVEADAGVVDAGDGLGDWADAETGAAAGVGDWAIWADADLPRRDHAGWQLEWDVEMQWRMIACRLLPRVAWSDGVGTLWSGTSVTPGCSIACRRRREWPGAVIDGLDCTKARLSSSGVGRSTQQRREGEEISIKVGLCDTRRAVLPASVSRSRTFGPPSAMNSSDLGGITATRFSEMNDLHNERKSRMSPNELIDSASTDDDTSDGSLNAGNQAFKKGPWTSAEDTVLIDYVEKYGEGNWNAVQKHTGLSRCGKSCRLRWANHLRPNLKKGSFTPEEEQLIIELHAKMGNKWARMAAYLPGRTDNEIKNYWNTRIKRRQRAGLPLYPPNICLQISDVNQQRENVECSYSVKQHPTELLLGSNFDIPVNFDVSHQALSYAPPFPNIVVGNMHPQSFPSPNNAFTNPTSTKELRKSESLIHSIHDTVCGKPPTYEHVLFEPPGKVQQNSGLGYPYDPDPSGKSLAPLGGAFPGSHSILNGNFSASSPAYGTVKLELPSLQHKVADDTSWLACSLIPVEAVDSYVESPPTTVLLQSAPVSPRNSGLLEALLHEAHALGNDEKKQTSEKSSSSSGFAPNAVVEYSGVSVSDKLEYHNDPISPFGHSASSAPSETPPISGSSFDEFPHAISSSSKNISLGQDCLRPDALLGSVWLEDGVQSADNHSVFQDRIAVHFGHDFRQYKPLPSEKSSMLGQRFGLDFKPWDNMPHAYQMP